MAVARGSRGQGGGSTVRGPGERGGSSFLAVVLRGCGLPGAGREYGDLGFPGDGLLGRGGVPEFRARCEWRSRLGTFRVCSAARAAASAAAVSASSDEVGGTWEDVMARTA